jgi:hypothetical protein
MRMTQNNRGQDHPNRDKNQSQDQTSPRQGRSDGSGAYKEQGDGSLNRVNDEDVDDTDIDEDDEESASSNDYSAEQDLTGMNPDEQRKLDDLSFGRTPVAGHRDIDHDKQGISNRPGDEEPDSGVDREPGENQTGTEDQP